VLVSAECCFGFSTGIEIVARDREFEPHNGILRSPGTAVVMFVEQGMGSHEWDGGESPERPFQ